MPYAESLAVQGRADALLLLMWDHPEEKGVLPGKLFEYMGAGKPVLAVGAGDGAAAQSSETGDSASPALIPLSIARQLRAWLEDKDESGRVQPLPEGPRWSSRVLIKSHTCRFLLQRHGRTQWLTRAPRPGGG